MALHPAITLLVLVVPFGLGGCEAPLQCTTTAVAERVSVKLDRELRENPRFLALHEPGRSRFTIDDTRQQGVADGALACTARFEATLATAAGPLDLERTVHFTAHRDRWDTYVEIVSLDVPQHRSGPEPKEAATP